MQHEVNGIIVVDKPVNISSARVVAILKRMFKARKVGHTGTLDPLATGLMICCINDATRLARFFLLGNKQYEAVLCLGVETDTQDSTGTVVAMCDEINISQHKIQSVFKKFTGNIQQYPPIYSALKHEGVPLYKLARQGNPVQKPPRQVYISHIDILEINLPEIRFSVSCSAGTYIRTLCYDIGKTLGCGGYLKQLRRVESCGFTLKDAIALKELEALSSSGRLSDKVIDMAEALRGMPEYTADGFLAEKISHGVKISKKDLLSCQANNTEGFIKIINANNELIAVLSHQSADNDFRYCCVFHAGD